MPTSRTRAFTVVELLIAVAVLVVVILATARIFGTASAVASYGEANSNLQQTAAAVERVVREDVVRMNPAGYLVIECIAVRNDIHNTNAWPSAAQFGGSAIAPLLDPTRPATALIRCDRVVFFSDGFDQTARFVGSFNMGPQGGNQQALSSRIYIGPAVQLPALRPVPPNLRPDPTFLVFETNFTPLMPWSFDSPPKPDLETAYWNIATGGQGANAFGTQPEARKWLLARQATLLGDDGGAKRYFNSDSSYGPTAAPAIWAASFPAPHFSTGQNDAIAHQGFIATASLYPDSWISSGRVDVAGSNLDDVRRTARLGSNGSVLPWIRNPDPTSRNEDFQWVRIRNMTFGPADPDNDPADLAGVWGWPRAEKSAPSMSRIDELLTASVLAGNCSSIEIDWTWNEGTGRVDAAGGWVETALTPTTSVALPGVSFDPGAGTVWFGLPDGVMPIDQRRGVTSLAGPSGTQVPEFLNDQIVYVDTSVFDSGANQWNLFNGSVFPIQLVNGVRPAAAIGAPVIPANIEGLAGVTRPLGASMPVWCYTAVFGFNHDQPTIETFDGRKALRDDYTPWPRALRFTMRLHDPRLTIETGRTFQFVVDLPRQTQE